MTLEEMRAQVQNALHEPVDEDECNGNINGAIRSLWGSLILVNPGEYLSRQPVKLTDNADILPFDEIANSEEFIQHYALTHMTLSVYEYQSSDAWERHAEEMRLACQLEVKQKMPQQNTIKPYQPSGSHV